MARSTLLRSGTTRFGLAVPAALMMTQTAFADVTATQVWEDWKQYMQGLGYTVSAQEARAGADLTVSDLSILVPAAAEGRALTMTLGPLTFVQNGGDVNIVMPDSMPIVMNAPDAQGEPWQMAFTFAQSDLDITVSGDPDDLTYDYNAATFALSLDHLMTDGETYGAENARINLTGTNLRSTTNMKPGDLRTYTQSGGIETVSYDMFMHNPIEDVKVTLKGGTSDLAFEGTSAIPQSPQNAADMSQMLKAGFAVAGGFTYGPGSLDMSVEQPSDGDFAASTTSSGGRLDVDMGADAVSYGAQQDNLQMSITSAELPFPVALGMVQAGFNLAMPLSPSQEPQDFALGMNFTGFEMADLLWSIFDPAGQLPRDPATIALDLSGQAKLLVDLMDPEAAASLDMPAQMQTLKLNTLLVDAVGAKLEGSGDFTFDNNDTTTYPGMPKPVGALNIALAGGNGLLDKLVAMGLLPEQQAMGARMMMGLFAVPGDAPDTMTSKVEFNAEGQILANGQRIK